MEKMRKRKDDAVPDLDGIELELRDQPEILRYLRMLPKALWGKHVAELDKLGANPVKKIEYMKGVVEARASSTEESHISEPRLRAGLSDTDLGARVRDLFRAEGAVLGVGQTARVKSFSVAPLPPIAVKYLLTPTEKTLSVDGEHDMLREVETVTMIEEVEHKLHIGQRIRVPHPYFYYKNESVQCYGMQEVSGVTLEQLVETEPLATVALSDRRAAALAALRDRYPDTRAEQALLDELEVFMRAVHEVCLHGDIKLGNVMADEKGDLYLIDFGQSVPLHTMTEEVRDRFENIQADEHARMRESIRAALSFARTHKEGRERAV